jgi:thiol-disulfide isomerase/thioredoxin
VPRIVDIGNWLRAWLCLCVLFAILTTGLAADQPLTALDPPVKAPGFNLPIYEGSLSADLDDYRGRPVIVNFWATWCPPCREELPSMNRAYERLRNNGVAMVAINVGEDEAQIFPFLADYPVEFPILLDRGGTIIDRWPVKGLPTTFIVDTQGNLVYRAIGARAWDDANIVDRILKLTRDSE